MQYSCNELGRLALGVGAKITRGTNTIFFIPRHKIPKDRFATYRKIIWDHKPFKTNKHQTGLTVGGEMIDYTYEVMTPTEDITALKCIIKSVLVTANAKFMGIDIKAFYLNTRLNIFKCIKLPYEIIPNKIRD